LDDYQIKATFNWWVRSNAKDQQVPNGRSTMEIAIERIEERKLERTAPVTGYPMLDDKMKGWIPGHLYVFTGDTNAGKSAISANFAYKVYQQGKKVTYFALEPDVSIMDYMAGIHHKKRWDSITDEDLKIDLQGMTIFTKDANMNLEKLVKTIQEMERQDLIIVDHIGYFTNNANDRRNKTEQESDAIKKIVSAAKKKRTAVMIIAHPRKPVGTNKKNIPLTMNEISGSASFKQDATDVLILHMDKDPLDQFGLTNAFTGSILLPKVKTGKPGSIPIRFIPDSPLMVEGNDQSDIPKIEGATVVRY
jgi:archaellum biogenesis ATPase FlaH